MTRIEARLRNALAFAHDVAAAAIAWLLAFYLRFNFDVPADFAASMWAKLAWLLPAQAAIFWRLSLYRGLWRYASLTDFRRIVVAAALGAMTVTAGLFVFQIGLVPRSALVLYPILLAAMMGGSRIAYRAWKEGHLARLAHDGAKRAVVLGAGSAAARLLQGVGRSGEWQFVGLLDDDPAKAGREIHGVKVLGALADLPRIAQRWDVRHAVIAMPGQSHAVRRRALEVARQAGLAAQTVPSIEDLVSGRVSTSSIRPVEVDDLLGRDPVSLDGAGLAGWLAGQVVMITGAGGSIGSELARQASRFAPRQLVLFETSEFALYTLEQEFHARFPETAIACVLGDVKDAARLDAVIGAFRPSVVLHAAAYKHVPLTETLNVREALRNNVLGTWRAADAAQRHGVAKFVLISTDKAVNPTSVMGASKRLAEMVCEALQRADGTRFVMVRFGNVLGSTGSVIPKFRQQIAAGGPVTVTHPEMTRYFMSIPEASQLVLQAGLMGQGGEIFVLDMGEPVKIVDLAREMIRLSGFDEEDIRIVFTGLRPGEKLYEELLADGEATLATPHPKLRIARARPVPGDLLDTLARWLEPSQAGAGGEGDTAGEARARATIARLVPEYTGAIAAQPSSPAAGSATENVVPAASASVRT